jgi:hypothetical protein
MFGADFGEKCIIMHFLDGEKARKKQGKGKEKARKRQGKGKEKALTAETQSAQRVRGEQLRSPR